MAVNGFSNQSVYQDAATAARSLSLRELCHDLIEPAATIRWLVGAAEAESGEDSRDRLREIAIAAGQIAAICDDILESPRCHGVRLDKLASEAVATARVRYAGAIEVVSQPVTALARPGDVIRILGNILANSCRAAGPDGLIKVLVEQAAGRARLSIADSGGGFGRGGTSHRTGLGLEIVGALTLKYGGGLHLGVSDLGGLAITVELPARQESTS